MRAMSLVSAIQRLRVIAKEMAVEAAVLKTKETTEEDYARIFESYLFGFYLDVTGLVPEKFLKPKRKNHVKRLR
jgi:hypothetical protein